MPVLRGLVTDVDFEAQDGALCKDCPADDGPFPAAVVLNDELTCTRCLLEAVT